MTGFVMALASVEPYVRGVAASALGVLKLMHCALIHSRRVCCDRCKNVQIKIKKR